MLNNLQGKINASYFIKQKLNQKYFCIVVSRDGDKHPGKNFVSRKDAKER
jgi:hypothetical protein